MSLSLDDEISLFIGVCDYIPSVPTSEWRGEVVLSRLTEGSIER